MFVDASVLVAILSGEPDAADLQGRLLEADSIVVSPIVIWETVRAVALENEVDPMIAHGRVTEYLDLCSARRMSVDDQVGEAAITALAAFGKGRHPARLNLGDCFAYGCARVLGEPLLCKGNDFGHTDIERA